MTLPEAIARRHVLLGLIAEIEGTPRERRAPTAFAQKNRFLSELRELKLFIKSQHRQQKMSDINLFRALVEIIDRAEELGFVLTQAEQDVLDDTTTRIEAIEAFEAP